MRQRVENLLAAYGQSSQFLEVSAVTGAEIIGPNALTDSESALLESAESRIELPGTKIGPYTLLSKLGEGGMGAVYLAEQEEPVRRRVALKIIKPGMGTDQVIARFAAERQALERMDHPNIARVLDAGTTQSGLPYFVMELVEGVPITRYCDEHRLTPRQRLKLFVPACHAVQHAHQKGIIHRDLKPSNVLVAVYDGKPVPKVIDFGVAKAVDKLRAEQTAFTRLGVLIGTPEYMSPEQADLDAGGVDTRSDIYSLGVVLYELLTGTTPLEAARLREAGWAQMLKSIREDQPPRPSTWLSTSGAAKAEISARRGTEARRLQRLLMGDLDQVVMKALEKECDRRYQTANGLARDIERYLDDEPVEARGPSTVYRLRKFTNKHRASLTFAAAIVGLLIAGTTVSTVEALREKHARDRAIIAETAANSQRDSAISQSKRADEEAAIKTAVNSFLCEDVIGQASPRVQAFPGHHANPKMTVREAVDRASALVGHRFIGRPRIEAAVRLSIGETYHHLGEEVKARENLETAISLARIGALGVRQTIPMMNSLAQVYLKQDRYDLAEPLIEVTLKESVTALGEKHPETLVALSSRANLLAKLNQLHQAEIVYDKVLHAQPEGTFEGKVGAISARNNLGVVYQEQGRFAEAESMLKQALDTSVSALGQYHPFTFQVQEDLARLYQETGNAPAAERFFRDALDGNRQALGRDHPTTLRTANNLATLYRSQARYPEAEQLLKDTLPRARDSAGETSALTRGVLGNFGTIYYFEGRHVESEAAYRTALELWRQSGGKADPPVVNAFNSMAKLEQEAGRFGEAEWTYDRALTTAESCLGRDNPETLLVVENWAGLLYELGRYNEAEAAFARALGGLRKGVGNANPRTLRELNNCGYFYARRGEYSKAEPLLKEAIAGYHKAFGDGNADTLTSVMNLAYVRARQGRLDEAEGIVRGAARAAGRTLGESDPITARATARLANLRAVRDAEALCREIALQGGPDRTELAAAELALATRLRMAFAFDEAERHAKAALDARHARKDSRGALEAHVEIARIHHLQGRDEAADSDLAGLAGTAREALGDGGPAAVQSAHAILNLSFEMARFDKGLLDDIVKALGEDERDTPVPLIELGRVLVDGTNYVEAEAPLRRSLELAARNRRDVWPELLAKCRLGATLMGEGKFNEAEPLLLESYAGLKALEPEMPRGAKPFISEARRRLAFLYDVLGREGDALRWRSDPLPTDPPNIWATLPSTQPATNPAE